MQGILFWDYGTPTFERIITHFKGFSDNFVSDNSSYNFHPIELKHGVQLYYEVTQRILFQGYSTQNFNRDKAL